jgi:hypothetical protein
VGVRHSPVVVVVGEAGSLLGGRGKERPSLVVGVEGRRIDLAEERRTGLEAGLRTVLAAGLRTVLAAGLHIGLEVVLCTGLGVVLRTDLEEARRTGLVVLESPNLDPGAEVGRMPAGRRAGGIVLVVGTG